ncbi:IS3 family transposase [Treponema sp. OMZ 798]|uniref:IS3 family transposase n=1 Tax=Treponema sp. OMZ 798 TaxID=2563671 RepID=UPI0020A39894|nr:IS3 family transposase [Treponema sp. OMZ 798]UTC79605.1 IS3 family transposase [Treponema sp. OMZ 798]
MGKIEKYSIDFKLEVVGKYERGTCGYKRLARTYGLSRDTVRDWCLNPRLHEITTMTRKKKINNEECDLEYYKTAALFWETYAKNIEAELAKQGKKKLVLKTMEDCLSIAPHTKIRKLCKVAGVSKSTFYYNRKNDSQAQKDAQIVTLLKKLPKEVLLRRGNKAKANIIRQKFGVLVNHKRIERICRAYGLLAKNRRRKFPKHYYEQRKQNKQNLPENILNRQFYAAEPLKKLCTDVSYFRTTKGWLYLSPVLDLYRNQISAYHMSTHNDEKPVMDMLDKLPCLEPGALLHSDQGAVYTSKAYTNRLREKKIIESMSRRATCRDNACMEHFFGTLKIESGYNELIKIRTPTEQEVRALIDNFIKYYNNERIQKNLGWQPPVEKYA